ncbi:MULTISPECIES: hypothetical protein [Methanobacterium]|uniref:Uncharacterized protein n=1 Tax=Methanobacterium bryantii TaxID=2161 RepID=A0A2A2H412_METBR|nr:MULTISPECIES: hypothetical protein [Methanobacterium]OEC86788.1 hypothetical protein A9507_10085 [Methanobacterium sp. A39]PAV04064.1 hypothetical protein ASJ80_03355 [Methanobacterium bryantii]
MDNDGIVETRIEFKFPEYEDTIDERRVLEQKIKNRLGSLESILFGITFQNDSIEIQEGNRIYKILNQGNNFSISDNSIQMTFKELTISKNIVEIKFLLNNVNKIIEKFHENNQRILTLGKKVL